MDPIIGGALISGAGSLLGGILNRNSAKSAASQNRKWALRDQAEQFVRLRAAAEKGGFNPLTVLGASPNSGMPNQTQAAQSYVGTAIADSAAMLADGMTKQQLAINAKAEDLARQKAILERKLTEATLRPDQPGIFQRGGKNGSALPLGPNPYDRNDQVAGLWIGGAFVPRPAGFSPGSVIEDELGDTVAAEFAVAPLSAAYTAASVPILARQGKLVEMNAKNVGRGMSMDWKQSVASTGNRGRAPLDLLFTGRGVVAMPMRNVSNSLP